MQAKPFVGLQVLKPQVSDEMDTSKSEVHEGVTCLLAAGTLVGVPSQTQCVWSVREAYGSMVAACSEYVWHLG